MIPAAYTAGNSGKVVKAKPELETKITTRLLNIDDTHHEPERSDLIKGYAIEAFSEHFEKAKDKDKIIEFVKQQLNSKSPKTRNIAEKFLSHIEIQEE